MRSLRTRRAVPVAGAATVAVLALAGCSAGQTAETSLLQTPISGLNTASADGALLVRNLQVSYNGVAGYPANGSAPLEVSLFNQTQNPITVTITSQPQQTGADGVVAAQQVGLSGSAPSASVAPEPSAGGTTSPSGAPSAGTSGEVSAPASAPSTPSGSSAGPAPTTAALQPARLTIAPLGSTIFRPGDKASLVAAGLTGKLAPGNSLALTIQSSTSATPLNVLAPVAIPLSPASRGPGISGENSEGE